MKGHIIILLLLLPFLSISQSYEFLYDSDGNRTIRRVMVLQHDTQNERNAETKEDSSNQKEEIKLSDKIGETQFNIFPNPSVGCFNIEVTNIENDQQLKLKIHTITGALVYEKDMNENTIVVDMSDKENGLYLLSLETNEDKVIWKIIKQ